MSVLETTMPSGLDESSGYLLYQVALEWQRAMKKELDLLDITTTQFVLLRVL